MRVPAPPPLTIPDEHAKPLVIVIDDDESVGRAIKRLLHSIGIAADSFASGEAFLKALSSMSPYPACRIIDVQMPGLSGPEVQRRLAVTGMPIIFITADADLNVRAQALSDGALAYLRKPFDDGSLIKAVRTAIG
ncbi:response regulator transcription factor [Paraburkholderia sediminicola]|uniref:response regulator transcription factor n=1 Tax=Paraburkholderia sediminicola TaxID=458836 RepID=UPI0038BE15DF